MHAQKAASLALYASLLFGVGRPILAGTPDPQKWPIHRDSITISYTLNSTKDILESARVRVSLPLDKKSNMTQAVPYSPDKRNVVLSLVEIDDAVRMDDLGDWPKVKRMGPELKTWALVPVNRFPNDVMNFEISSQNGSDFPSLDPCKSYALELVLMRAERQSVGRQRVRVERPDLCVGASQ